MNKIEQEAIESILVNTLDHGFMAEDIQAMKESIQLYGNQRFNAALSEANKKLKEFLKENYIIVPATYF